MRYRHHTFSVELFSFAIHSFVALTMGARVELFPCLSHVRVSSDGVIQCQSISQANISKGVWKTLNPFAQTAGYLAVRFRPAGETKYLMRSVAFLVCRTFHGPKPTERHTVDHINRNRADNRATNLRWATMSEQAFNRTQSATYAERPCRTRKIHKLDLITGDVIETFDTVREAAYSVVGTLTPTFKQMSAAISNISKVLAKRRPRTRGFGWSATEATTVADEEGEEWKPVQSATRHLHVSSHGRVKRRKRERSVQDEEELVHCPIARRLMTNPSGYFQILYGKTGPGGTDQVCTQVHRLVATAFLGPCPPGLVVRHLDNNTTNNHVDNLAYAKARPFRKRKRADDDDGDEIDEI